MKYICSACKKEAYHNERLGINFCKVHGFTIKPVIKKSKNV